MRSGTPAPVVLILRAQPAAQATADAVGAAGMTPLIHPLFALRTVEWQAPAEATTALLLTSANAVRLAGPMPGALARLPAFVVGPATAAAARDAGLTVAFVGRSDGAEAMRAMAAAGHRVAVHLRGAVARPLPDDVRLLPVVTYAADPTAEPLPRDLAGAIVLLHSQRAAALFAERLDETGTPTADLSLAAISPTVAEAAGSGWRRVEVAKRPTDAALLEAAATLARSDWDSRA